MKNKKEWNQQIVSEIKSEAQRVLYKISEFELESKKAYVDASVAPINRATLDFNRVAVKLRKGYWEAYRDNEAYSKL